MTVDDTSVEILKEIDYRDQKGRQGTATGASDDLYFRSQEMKRIEGKGR